MHIKGAMISNADITLDDQHGTVFSHCFFFNCRIIVEAELRNSFQHCHFHESCIFDPVRMLRVSVDCAFDRKPSLAS